MANRYVFEAVLEGYINVDKPAGKYNNCCFSFRLPAPILEQAEQDREELLKWASSKVDNPKRIVTNLPKWDEEGLVKYSYGGDTPRDPVIFVDTDGQVLDEAVRASIRKGTKVKLIVDQKPYTKPALGTTLKVLGAQVIELVSGVAADRGDLTEEDVLALFAGSAVSGFKQSSPSPRRAEPEANGDEDAAYDF
ncbi:hypothetical protein [Cyanobium sp. A2C-AMD]|uniref:hypothetical protein n=1 Tax=Cyanobium sp. A2C-AMD TaxID=2823695 RepID=UPI0020CD8D52|nr:hypothetical protein [Cyanobium sp. A2C-AMD]MCP9877332.1 hypothetical protein [Cyanobium sp. A2C-AMD]